jgi:hypothetical protein
VQSALEYHFEQAAQSLSRVWDDPDEGATAGSPRATHLAAQMAAR